MSLNLFVAVAQKDAPGISFEHSVCIGLSGARCVTVRLFVCLACKEKRGIDISYGDPGPDLIAHVEQGNAVLGGRMQEIGPPDRQCLACGGQWEIARHGAVQQV